MVIGPAEASAFTYSGDGTADDDDAAAAAAAAAAALDVGRNPIQSGFDVFVDVCFLVDMCHNFRVGIRDESKPMAVRESHSQFGRAQFGAARFGLPALLPPPSAAALT